MSKPRSKPDKTPDWPVDMGAVVSRLKLAKGSVGCNLVALSLAMERCGWPNEIWMRTLAADTTSRHLTVDALAIKFNDTLCTLNLDRDWDAILRRASKKLKSRSLEGDEAWVSEPDWSTSAQYFDTSSNILTSQEWFQSLVLSVKEVLLEEHTRRLEGKTPSATSVRKAPRL